MKDNAGTGRAQMTLQRSLTVFMIVLTALALVVAVFLVVLPTYAHRAALDVQKSLHSVRLAEQIQLDLLSYIQIRNPLLRRQFEEDLRQKLTLGQMLFTDPEEHAALREASLSISQFENEGQEARDDQNVQRAFDSLERLVVINVEQAEVSVRAAARFDRIGDWIGIGAALLLALGITGVLAQVFTFRDRTCCKND